MLPCAIRAGTRRGAVLVVALAAALAPGGCGRDARGPAGRGQAPGAKAYRFSTDWFSPDIPVWQEVLGPLAGKPGLRYLEVGVFEGRSAVWMLQHILTDRTARLTGVDIFPGDLMRTFRANVALAGGANKTTAIKGRSQLVLRGLPAESFDIIYIDGSHRADDVMADAVQGWQLLRLGGILIFDDYGWRGYDQEVPDRRTLPADLRPQLALDAFLSAYRSSLDVVHRGYQLILRKRADPCPLEEQYHCSPLGDFVYLWHAQALLRRGTNQRVPLTVRERDLIEQYLLSVPFGRTEPDPPPALRRDPAFRGLVARLGLTVPEPPPDAQRAAHSSRPS